MGEIIVIVLLIIAIVVVLPLAIYTKISDVKRSLDHTNDKLRRVLDVVEDLKRGSFKPGTQEEKSVIVKKEVSPPVAAVIKPVEVIKQEVIPEVSKETVIPEVPKEVVKEEPIPSYKETVKEKPWAAASEKLEEVDERIFVEEKDIWFKKIDWERFIGENLANKIGIAVLVLGIAFFVKYAIDKDWVNETGRVAIGLVCGGILIGLAHYIRNSYRSFSSVLVGGGLTVFYFTIAFAFHEYHLISQQAAFIIMVIISTFAVLLSLFYNRQELAILATIGGFITPFLVSTGQNNYIALFTYLCILNTGLMVLAWFKRWIAINIIAFVFTTFIFGGWVIDKGLLSLNISFPYKDAFLFGTLFYILFVIMNVINSLRTHRKFTAFDFIILLSTNFLYFGAGMLILSFSDNENSKGIFTASLGILNLVLAAAFYNKKNVDRNFVALLIGLAVTFISLTGPVHFEGNAITLFWAAEMVILFWLYQRSKINQLKFASLLIAVPMFVSLLYTWADMYIFRTNVMPVLLNKGFITTWVVAIALFIYYVLLRKENEDVFPRFITNKSLKGIMLASSLLVAYIAGLFEINYQFFTRYRWTDLQFVYVQVYTFAVAILMLHLFRRSQQYALLKFIFTALCLGLYLINININYSISLDLLDDPNSIFFSAHWVAAALLFWLLYDMVRYFFQQKNSAWASYQHAFTWMASASIVLLLSAEMRHVILWVFMDMKEADWWDNLYFKPGLTILWSLCSFVMMWLGMKYNFRMLRVISLTLFTITLVKLFSYDIVKIPPGGKIAAFILLGVLLLTVSFMYQRLKKIIMDNSAE